MQKTHENPSDAAHGKKPARGTQTLAKRVREALLSLGGEAHRAMVIESVAKKLGHDVRQIHEDLEVAVILSFATRTQGQDRASPARCPAADCSRASRRFNSLTSSGARPAIRAAS